MHLKIFVTFLPVFVLVSPIILSSVMFVSLGFTTPSTFFTLSFLFTLSLSSRDFMRLVGGEEEGGGGGTKKSPPRYPFCCIWTTTSALAETKNWVQTTSWSHFRRPLGVTSNTDLPHHPQFISAVCFLDVIIVFHQSILCYNFAVCLVSSCRVSTRLLTQQLKFVDLLFFCLVYETCGGKGEFWIRRLSRVSVVKGKPCSQKWNWLKWSQWERETEKECKIPS